MKVREEGSTWVDEAVCSLVRRAAHRAPPALSQRLEEEWLADLAARRGGIPRLRFALGCSWATRVIACELGTPARAAATATGHNTATVCVETTPRFNARRTTVVLLIAALHTLVIYGLATGVARQIFATIDDPIQVTPFSDDARRITPPAPLVDPKLTQLNDVISPPLALEFPPQDGIAAIRDVQTQVPSAPPQPPTPPPPPNRIAGGPGAGFPDTDDFYPAAARALGEQGVATIHVCVDSAGRLAADPSVVESSGSARLDQGALRLAQAGSGHYRATTEDGRPISSCYLFRVRFHLKDRMR